MRVPINRDHDDTTMLNSITTAGKIKNATMTGSIFINLFLKKLFQFLNKFLVHFYIIIILGFCGKFQ